MFNFFVINLYYLHLEKLVLTKRKTANVNMTKTKVDFMLKQL